MPIYEFVCQDCKKSFEVLCSIKTDLSTIACEMCGSRKVEKKVSRFATSGGIKTLDLGGSGNYDNAGASHSSCGSCSTHSCSTCGH